MKLLSIVKASWSTPAGMHKKDHEQSRERKTQHGIQNKAHTELVMLNLDECSKDNLGNDVTMS